MLHYNKLCSLEDELIRFSIKENIEVNSEEILSVDFDLAFRNKQVMFSVFNSSISMELFYLFENCCNSKQVIDEKLTLYEVDEVNYLLYDDVDYFVVFYDEAEKQDFENLIESQQIF